MKEHARNPIQTPHKKVKIGNLKVPRDLYERFKTCCKKEGRTISTVGRRIVKDYVDNFKEVII